LPCFRVEPFTNNYPILYNNTPHQWIGAGIPNSLSCKLHTSSHVKPIITFSIGGCTVHPKPIPPTPPNGFVTPTTKSQTQPSSSLGGAQGGHKRCKLWRICSNREPGHLKGAIWTQCLHSVCRYYEKRKAIVLFFALPV